VRHRLSRAGDGKLNHALYLVAMVQVRRPSAGQAYYRRKLAEGKSPKEALRCLKRRLSDAVYRCLLADQHLQPSSAGWPERRLPAAGGRDRRWCGSDQGIPPRWRSGMIRSAASAQVPRWRRGRRVAAPSSKRTTHPPIDEKGWRPIATGSGRRQRPTAKGQAAATQT
jgi:hypothetical protein